MALLVSFHAALLSFGNASMMSRSVYEVALSGSTIFRRSATRRAGSVSPQFLSSVREICISRLSLLIRRFCRSEEHTSELQSRFDLVCRLLLEKKKNE